MFEAKFQTFTENASSADSAARLRALRAELKRERLDGFLVPRADEHQNEYVAECDERLAWLTGFTGSAGIRRRAGAKGGHLRRRALRRCRCTSRSTHHVFTPST